MWRQVALGDTDPNTRVEVVRMRAATFLRPRLESAIVVGRILVQFGVPRLSRLALHRRVTNPTVRVPGALRVRTLVERVAAVRTGEPLELPVGDPVLALGRGESVELAQRQAERPSDV